MTRLQTIEWSGTAVRIIDQTALPCELVYEDIETVEAMVDAIRKLKVRGAPAIGVAAAFGLFLGMRDFPDNGSISDFLALLEKNVDYLAQSRPTAVNLFRALDRLKHAMNSMSAGNRVAALKSALLDEAQKMLCEDRAACRAIGEHGFDLLKDCRAILTHCNAGGLATSGCGTALAPVYVARDRGTLLHVYSDETRPLLQGSRITAFELQAAGIPVTVICDNMAATVMREGKVDAVIVGADRIAANGDVANKIGTYGLAIVAKAHGVPFYVAAPLSTFDISLDSGEKIPIEMRSPDEVTHGFGKRTAPEGVAVYNPAFDITPAGLIAAIVTEHGVLRAPYGDSIRALIGPDTRP